MIPQAINLLELNNFQVFVERCPSDPSNSCKFRGGQLSILIGQIEFQKCHWDLVSGTPIGLLVAASVKACLGSSPVGRGIG